MPEEVEPVVENLEETSKPAEAPEPVKPEAAAPAGQPRPPSDRGPRPEKGKGASGPGSRPAQAPGGDRGNRPPGGGGDRGPRSEGGPRGGERREGGRPNFGGGGRPFDGPVDIELEKLISDSLYLDNQAHVVVMRMRDMDSGTKSQLRRLYNAVRRAVRAPESERQHQFVMLRARLAYTIARHSLRSLDALERLLLQVTRKNDARGYERFKDLFEAIVAYNE
jgi:CRISPR type III-A-associated protein Csm2